MGGCPGLGGENGRANGGAVSLSGAANCSQTSIRVVVELVLVMTFSPRRMLAAERISLTGPDFFAAVDRPSRCLEVSVTARGETLEQSVFGNPRGSRGIAHRYRRQ